MAQSDVEIRLRLNDEASSGLKRTEQDAQKGAERTASATERAATRAAAAAERGAAMQRNSYQRMAQAREQLGMRSERSIQREIQRTEAAYLRLKASGTMSWREQARAADQMRTRVTQLTNEMGKLTAAQKAMGALKIGAAGVAGVAAAGYALKGTADKAADYNLRMAHLTNSVYSGRSKEEKAAKKAELDGIIDDSVRQTKGGATSDDAITALGDLTSRGKMSVDEAKRILPDILKAAATSQTDVGEILQIAIKSKDFGIKNEDLPNILNMAAAGGRAGGFTLKNMARWMPKQMVSAQNRFGMGGKEDFATLIALNQAATKTAATEDEAGGNVERLLQKMNSEQVAKAVKKATGKDMRKYLQDQRSQGVSSIEAFGSLIEQSIAKNPRYKALQTKLASTKDDDERRATLESMSTMAENSSIGQLIQDRKAMMALLSLLNNKEEMNAVKSAVLGNDVAKGGIIDSELSTLGDTFSYRGNLASENVDAGTRKELQGVLDAGGNILDKFNDFAAENSSFVGKLSIATTALTTFAGAVGLATFAMGGGKMLGRAGGAMMRGAGAAGRAAAGGTRAVAGGISAVAASGMGAARTLGTAAKLGTTAAKLGMGVAKGGLAGIAAAGGEVLLDKAFGENSTVSNYGSAALTGASTGAMIGSIIPGVGTAIGAAVGGAVGLIGRGLYDLFSSDDTKEQLQPAQTQEQGPVEVITNLQVTLDPALRLQNQQMWVRGAPQNTGNVFVGAP